MREISLVIPSYNGKHILEKFLPSMIKASKSYRGLTEVVIVDDGSSDGTDEFLQRHFPEVRLLCLLKNRGYGFACNWGISNSKYDLVVLLNNDVWVRSDFLNYLPNYFEQEDVFAVRIRVGEFKEERILDAEYFTLTEPVWIRGEFRFGFVYVPAAKSCPLKDTPKGRYAFSVGAGAFAVDKKKWLQLGGFDDLFYPLYVEETDIAYRALKRGLKIIYEPKSIAFHQGHATVFKTKSHRYLNLVGERNRYFLVWKNMTDRGYILRHLLFIPLRLINNLIKRDFISFLSFFYGLRWLPEVWKRRKIEKRESKLRDREIFDFFRL